MIFLHSLSHLAIHPVIILLPFIKYNPVFTHLALKEDSQESLWITTEQRTPCRQKQHTKTPMEPCHSVKQHSYAYYANKPPTLNSLHSQQSQSSTSQQPNMYVKLGQRGGKSFPTSPQTEGFPNLKHLLVELLPVII